MNAITVAPGVDLQKAMKAAELLHAKLEAMQASAWKTFKISSRTTIRYHRVSKKHVDLAGVHANMGQTSQLIDCFIAPIHAEDRRRVKGLSTEDFEVFVRAAIRGWADDVAEQADVEASVKILRNYAAGKYQPREPQPPKFSDADRLSHSVALASLGAMLEGLRGQIKELLAQNSNIAERMKVHADALVELLGEGQRTVG